MRGMRWSAVLRWTPGQILSTLFAKVLQHPETPTWNTLTAKWFCETNKFGGTYIFELANEKFPLGSPIFQKSLTRCSPHFLRFFECFEIFCCLQHWRPSQVYCTRISTVSVNRAGGLYTADRKHIRRTPASRCVRRFALSFLMPFGDMTRRKHLCSFPMLDCGQKAQGRTNTCTRN